MIRDFDIRGFLLQGLRDYLRRWAAGKHVRPWALSAPIAALLICLPLLSPLRHPIPGEMSDEEMARWATVQALVEQQTFAIDGTLFGKNSQRVASAGVSSCLYSLSACAFVLTRM